MFHSRLNLMYAPVIHIAPLETSIFGWGAGYEIVGYRVYKVGSRVFCSGVSGTKKWGLGYSYNEASINKFLQDIFQLEASLVTLCKFWKTAA